MNKKLFLFLRISLIVSIGAIVYLAFQNYLLDKNVSLLGSEVLQIRDNFASTTKIFKGTINSTQQELAQTKVERDDFEQRYLNELSRLNLLDVKVQGIQGTVTMLEKLRQIDPELLKKYSKVYFLSENYSPESLIKINSKYTRDPKSDYFFYSKAWPFLQNLLTAAENEGVDIKINSAYRSFATQAQIKAYHNMVYGSGANQFSADQGYSEHQLGTTVDFTTSGIGADLSDFENTSTYLWLLGNAHKYGFILSYPKDNQYYIFESWHWRFVGRALADHLHGEGKYFYDFSQREVDNYLINFFD